MATIERLWIASDYRLWRLSTMKDAIDYRLSTISDSGDYSDYDERL